MDQGRKPLIRGARRGPVPRRSEIKNSMDGIFNHLFSKTRPRQRGVGFFMGGSKTSGARGAGNAARANQARR
jgi:hypothetical protein